jgi:hypothetical protein
MLETDKEFKILNTDKEEIKFRISGYEIIPYSNFRLAYLWFRCDLLTPESKTLMQDVILGSIEWNYLSKSRYS